MYLISTIVALCLIGAVIVITLSLVVFNSSSSRQSSSSDGDTSAGGSAVVDTPLFWKGKRFQRGVRIILCITVFYQFMKFLSSGANAAKAKTALHPKCLNKKFYEDYDDSKNHNTTEEFARALLDRKEEGMGHVELRRLPVQAPGMFWKFLGWIAVYHAWIRLAEYGSDGERPLSCIHEGGEAVAGCWMYSDKAKVVRDFMKSQSVETAVETARLKEELWAMRAKKLEFASKIKNRSLNEFVNYLGEKKYRIKPNPTKEDVPRSWNAPLLNMSRIIIPVSICLTYQHYQFKIKKIS